MLTGISRLSGFSRSGILIPATAAADRRLVWGEVIALGPTVRRPAATPV